jgi:ubiquinone/menaquinone biosynthesis C-methylase UbiE
MAGEPRVPAAGRDWLLPFYDLFTRLLGIESSHRRLLQQAAIRPGYRVLEIGCDTGNPAILARRLDPTAGIFGIDPDPQALPLARAKAGRAGCLVEFGQTCSEQLPFPDAFSHTVLPAFTLALALDSAQKARS